MRVALTAAVRIALTLGATWLAACTLDPAQNPAWSLAGHPGLLLKIKNYCERNAFEENGRCFDPIMEGVNRSQVLAEDEQGLVVALQYRYRDYIRDRRRATMFRECAGYAARTFTIAKNEDVLEVVEMDGPQRGAPRGTQ